MADLKCPIVGIGASAGGLKALEALFAEMPTDTGAAFVVVQHLDPKHPSLVAEILGRHTKMPAVQVKDGMKVEADHVYVIPPNTSLTLNDHVFALGKAVIRKGLRMPIDTFLLSLAEKTPERAIAIIVSGTGSDGTQGVRAIKGAGGLTMAQSPETAEHDGMPRAAIATGMVDIVCPVEEMHEHLRSYLVHPYVRGGETSLPADDYSLGTILSLVQRGTGTDFRNFKPGTVVRRITRRMGLHHIESLAAYAAYLRQHSGEVEALYRDLLIGVTAFLRDPEAFEALETKAIAPIIAGKADDEIIRVWVPACSSGEEAYTIAMLLFEQLEAAHKHCPVQIFATDLDEAALEVGRSGVYPENQLADLSPERLRRFFFKEDHSYRVRKQLREAVTFAKQNVLSDPPFSRIDLISCRNLLIYLDSEAHERILGYFHFALREGGYLYLGHSETVGQRETLFETIDGKARLFRRKPAVLPVTFRFPLGPGAMPQQKPEIAPVRTLAAQSRIKEQVQQQLLQKFAPAAVLIDGTHQVLYFFGPTSRYLGQPSGTPTHDLLNLADDDLRPQLRAALQKAIAGDGTSAVQTARVPRGRSRNEVTMTVTPTNVPGQSIPFFLVTFEDQPLAEPASPRAPTGDGADAVKNLELELNEARENLEAKVQELEAANEELQAANEEVMSVNEELQSTNEEM